MHIIVRDDVHYIIKGMSEEVATEMRELIKSTGKENLRLYFTIYRTIMGLPTDITMKEERELLTQRYGRDIINNAKFVSDTILAQREYEAKKAVLPDLIEWLVMDRGVKVAIVDEVFYV